MQYFFELQTFEIFFSYCCFYVCLYVPANSSLVYSSLGSGVALQTAPEERAAAEAGGGAVVEVAARALPADLTTVA